MLDTKRLRQDLEATAQQLARRGFQLDVKQLAKLETQRKEIQVRTQQLQNERNTRSREIGKAKAQGEDVAPLMKQVASLGDQLKEAEAQLVGVQEKLDEIMLGIPNIPHASVPDGKDENDKRFHTKSNS